MEKVNQILVDTLKVSIEDAAKNLTMDDVNNWDSLTHMNLIVAIEDDFGVELSHAGQELARAISYVVIQSLRTKLIWEELLRLIVLSTKSGVTFNKLTHDDFFAIK